MNPPRPPAIPVLIAVATILALKAFAQTLPPSAAARPAARTEEEPVVELLPFVISETAQTGWIATETLAGSRLRTNFRDVPNQIETLTRDFMDDLGVSNLDQALIYTANVENWNDYMPATTASTARSPSSPSSRRRSSSRVKRTTAPGIARAGSRRRNSSPRG